jgi:UDP-N-acetylglucosamine--N-acetylmuramyl-(pentapeptide) pyrophosphoryl-undecaprenol N-acetylglucosamine transferase
MTGRTIVLATGGTGGHMFPAQALADELLFRDECPVLLTDDRGAERSAFDSRVDVYTVRAGTFRGQSPLGRARGFVSIAAGCWEAHSLLKDLGPAVVVGFGGYPSLPTMLSATYVGMRTMIHEQNAVLGRVNRMLAPRVDSIAVAYLSTQQLSPGTFSRVTVIGNPVRDAIVAVRDIPYTIPDGSGPFELLVFGGSQGAAIFSDVIPKALTLLSKESQRRLRVTQQCRPEDLERVRGEYDAAGIVADLSTFFNDLPARLAVAHAVIGRAGASTLCELTVAGRPGILVPYPHATDNHQTANAKALADEGAAWLIPEDRLSPRALVETLDALLVNPAYLADVAEKARNIGRPNAAQGLADVVCRLASANGDAGHGIASDPPPEEAA